MNYISTFRSLKYRVWKRLREIDTPYYTLYEIDSLRSAIISIEKTYINARTVRECYYIKKKDEELTKWTIYENVLWDYLTEKKRGYCVFFEDALIYLPLSSVEEELERVEEIISSKMKN